MRFLIATALLLTPASAALCAGTCCRVCHKGKACGNTCIAANRVCHTAGGCACDG